MGDKMLCCVGVREKEIKISEHKLTEAELQARAKAELRLNDLFVQSRGLNEKLEGDGITDMLSQRLFLKLKEWGQI